MQNERIFTSLTAGLKLTMINFSPAVTFRLDQKTHYNLLLSLLVLRFQVIHVIFLIRFLIPWFFLNCVPFTRQRNNSTNQEASDDYNKGGTWINYFRYKNIHIVTPCHLSRINLSMELQIIDCTLDCITPQPQNRQDIAVSVIYVINFKLNTIVERFVIYFILRYSDCVTIVFAFI